MKSHYDGLEFNKSKAKKSSNENVFTMESEFRADKAYLEFMYINIFVKHK